MDVAAPDRLIHWQVWATQDPYTRQWVMHSPNFGIKETCFAHNDFYFCKAMVVNHVTKIINMQKNNEIPGMEMKTNEQVGPVPPLYKSIPARSL